MPPESGVQARHFNALGTTCSLFGVGVSRRDLQQGESWVRELGARLTRFTSESEVARLNAADGRWIDVSPELEDVLRESLFAFELSLGLVNIAVLPSMLAIGYTQPLSEGDTIATLDRARPLPRLPAVLEVRAGRARLERGSGIDLGGIAKGWMADRLCEWLGGNVLANLGGDLRGVGTGPDGAGWPVGLASATVMLKDQGAATSSVRRRRWDDLHHLIDPRTGLPARSGLEEVSVVAGTGVAAEVIAKTALIGGPDVAPAFCASHALAWWLSPAP